MGAIALALGKQVGSRGLVLAFEPGAFLFRRFADNVALNPRFHKTVKPIQLGLGSEAAVRYWAEDKNNRGNASLWSTTDEGEAVQVMPLDDYLERHPLARLDFVKIDVEGMELEVIQGGMETWRKHRPAIYYETLRAYEAFRGTPVLLEIERLLTSVGYRFFRTSSGGELVETRYPDLSNNTLALPAPDSPL